MAEFWGGKHIQKLFMVLQNVNWKQQLGEKCCCHCNYPETWEMTQKGASLCTKWSERHFLDWKTCSVKWWCTISLSKIQTCMRKVNVSCLKYFFWEVKLGRILWKVNVSLSQVEKGSWEEVKTRNMQLKNKNWEYYDILKRSSVCKVQSIH